MVREQVKNGLCGEIIVSNRKIGADYKRALDLPKGKPLKQYRQDAESGSDVDSMSTIMMSRRNREGGEKKINSSRFRVPRVNNNDKRS